MCDCKKNTDSYCDSCGGDSFLGFKVDVSRKESKEKKEPREKSDKDSSDGTKKKFNLTNAVDKVGELGDSLKGFLSGLKKKGPSSSETETEPEYTTSGEPKSNMPMILGIVAAIIAVSVVIYFSTKSK